MRPVSRGGSIGERIPLTAEWALASARHGQFGRPADLRDSAFDWSPIGGPATVAACLRASGQWSLSGPPSRFDASDWWYRARFRRPGRSELAHTFLVFDGLATLAEVWLNDRPIFSSRNMFIRHEHDVGALLQDDNELVICCRSLDETLHVRRPRPRWRAPMVENQQLRWVRTTLLGRTPGWSPPVAPVGPWRPIWLESRKLPHAASPRLSTSIEGDDGLVEFSGEIPIEDGSATAVKLQLTHGPETHQALLRRSPGGAGYEGNLRIGAVRRWWPHTHGEPSLYSARLIIDHGHDEITLELGAVGFRTVTVDTREGDFSLRLNGVRIFCRGACWTPTDPVSLNSTREELEAMLDLVCNAGMNMLRIPGTLVYESDEFLDLCDAMGILLWQDFMFANLDYPEHDPDFVESVIDEARHQLTRLKCRPSLAILCGNSEVEQQAAMWGVPREHWHPSLFHQTLAELAGKFCPDVPYWPSSAHGGSFPHIGNVGTTSYFGVGAYLQPLEDARKSGVRFASECLAFANVPGKEALASLLDDRSVAVHHAAWKMRSPRDLGAGWDFDDVRDHYFERLFEVDPLSVRYADHERYLDLSRVLTGEIMAAVFNDWRRRNSACRGALVLFWRDLWPGAGWGVIDAGGRPKAAYYYLLRALQPVAVSISDEGNNGLLVHLINERESPLEVSLEIALYSKREKLLVSGTQSVTLEGRTTIEMAATDLFEGFLDLSYAYRFGQAAHDLVAASIRGPNNSLLGRDFFFVGGLAAESPCDIGLAADVVGENESFVDLRISTRRFAQSIWIEAAGFVPEDAYFHLPPNSERLLRMRRQQDARLRGKVHALNAATPARIKSSADA